MKNLVDYWKNSFDWRKQERILNQYDQFVTNIEGLDIHFLRVHPMDRNLESKAKPLLLLHGWPGSVVEFYKIIPFLIDPLNHGGTDNDVFEVVCPSIPGYGFSQAAEKEGLDVVAVARIFSKLMARLGFSSYYVQGGDWGSILASTMAIIDKQ
jgi:microsomal epoxide hydrolase